MEAQKGVIMRRSKRTRALAYIMVGLVMAIASGLMITYVWFSGTFLANMWWQRKIVYALLIVALVAGIWLVTEGTRYLSKKKRRR